MPLSSLVPFFPNHPPSLSLLSSPSLLISLPLPLLPLPPLLCVPQRVSLGMWRSVFTRACALYPSVFSPTTINRVDGVLREAWGFPPPLRQGATELWVRECIAHRTPGVSICTSPPSSDLYYYFPSAIVPELWGGGERGTTYDWAISSHFFSVFWPLWVSSYSWVLQNQIWQYKRLFRRQLDRHIISCLVL